MEKCELGPDKDKCENVQGNNGTECHSLLSENKECVHSVPENLTKLAEDVLGFIDKAIFLNVTSSVMGVPPIGMLESLCDEISVGAKIDNRLSINGNTLTYLLEDDTAHILKITASIERC